jgi:DNA-binding response OmpR family regulator
LNNNILIIDDSEDIRKLYHSILSSDFNLKILDSGKGLFSILDKFLPELIILDVMMPEETGFDICLKLKNNENYKSIPIIFVSGKVGSDSRTQGYKLNADKYLEKPFEVTELIAMINSSLSSHSVFSNEYHIKNLSINIELQTVKVDSIEVKLTTSEFRIIHLLSKNKGEIISREKILNVVASSKVDVSDRLVDAHISSIRKKLKSADISINSVYGSGYTLK